MSSDDLHRAYTNLGDMLDQDGQLEEAIQLALEGVEKARGDGTTRSWAGFFLLGRGREVELAPRAPGGRSAARATGARLQRRGRL